MIKSVGVLWKIKAQNKEQEIPATYSFYHKKPLKVKKLTELQRRLREKDCSPSPVLVCSAFIFCRAWH